MLSRKSTKFSEKKAPSTKATASMTPWALAAVTCPNETDSGE